MIETANREISGKPFEPVAPRPFKVVIVYDTTRLAQKVMLWVDELVAKAGETEVQRDLWCFEALATSAERNAAVDSAAKADLLIVVTRGDIDLPAGVKVWLEKWASTSTVDGSALVTFFHGEEKSRPPQLLPQEFLQTAAARAHHPFFHHRLQTFEHITPGPAMDSYQSLTGSTGNSGNGFFARDWGLNE